MFKQVEVPEMWTFPKAKTETGLTRFTLTQLVKSGKIKYIRLGAGQRGKILINAQSLCNFMMGGVE